MFAAKDLNFHHVLYFWTVCEERTLVAAAKRLRLTHSTLSKQIKELERALGAPLFERRGRLLELTPFGREVREYAADIVRVGGELVEFASGRAQPRSKRLRVGCVASIPKTLVHALLAPAFDTADGRRAVVRQVPRAELYPSLAAGKLDVALVDEIAPPSSERLESVHLGDTEVLWYGTKALAQRFREGFPSSFADAPLILPSHSTPLRRQLDAWLVRHRVTNSVQFEVDDAGILRAFGAAGRGLIPVRAALRTEVEDLHGMVLVGRCDDVRERYYLLTTELSAARPSVRAIIESAQQTLLAPAKGARRSVTARTKRRR
ncbi:MAG: LysR family transcriptional regulator [Polyangiales bacterium]